MIGSVNDGKVQLTTNRSVSVVDLAYQYGKLHDELQLVYDVLLNPDPTVRGKYGDVSDTVLISALIPRITKALDKTYIKGFTRKKSDQDTVEGVYIRAQHMTELPF